MAEFCVLSPVVHLERTCRFSVYSFPSVGSLLYEYDVDIEMNCTYSSLVIRSAAQRRPWCHRNHNNKSRTRVTPSNAYDIQIKDFENIVWENVMTGDCGASSYLVRKGLSRKAQLSLQLKRYCSKHPESALKCAVPYTIVIETWNAFEEMKLDFGRGTFATFDDHGLSSAPLRQRLDWCLVDAKETVEEPSHADWLWILKPSVTNKGYEITVAQNWEQILDALENCEDIREWVLQRYIDRPLLLGGHKFHLRVYVLCVGALRVFVYDKILVLIAAHRYKADDLEDIYGHLTNTARAAEDVNFDEKKFVRILEDLPSYLMKKYSDRCPDLKSANETVNNIRKSVHSITGELFAAYENEYSTFCPMQHCFEVYGLDFLVDEDFGVHLLEVNPGPDFKQTGSRLQGIIAQLWEEIFQIVLDSGLIHPQGPHATATHEEVDSMLREKWGNNAQNFTLVYSKEWSCAKHKGGMAFIEK